MKKIENGIKSEYISGGILNGCNCDLCQSCKEDIEHIKPPEILSQLRRRTEEELKESRCNAYEYLIP